MQFLDEEDRIRYLKQVIFKKKSALPSNLTFYKHPKMGGTYYALDKSTGIAYIVFEDSDAVEEIPKYSIPGFEHLK